MCKLGDSEQFYLPKHVHNHPRPGRTPRESFFPKIPNVWAWAEKLGRKMYEHFGYFRPNYSTHHLGTVSPLSIVLGIERLKFYSELG